MIFNNESLFLEGTWRCNQNCVYCVRQQLSAEEQVKDMSFEKIVEVLDNFPRLKEFVFIGAGEPLLHPDWDKIVEMVRKRNLHLQFSTNGVLLTPEKAKRLPPDTHVYVSLDSVDPEKYHSLRGGELKVVMDNLPHIAACTNLVLQPVITRGFINEVDIYMDLVRGLNATVSPILPLCYSKEQFMELYPPKGELRTTIARIKGRATMWNRAYAEPTLQSCRDPFHNLFVAVNGDIYPCCYIYSARPYLNREDKWFNEYYPDCQVRVPAEQYYLGNVFKGEFNLDRLQNIRAKVNGTGRADFNLRGKLDLSEPNEYCRICLNRWGCAC